MSREATVSAVRENLLQSDIQILNDHTVADEVMAIMAAEHAARVETLGKAIEPTLGRSLLLILADRLLAAAKQIEAATVQSPEIVHV